MIRLSSDDRLKELGLVTPSLSEARAIDALSVPAGKANRTLSVVTIKEIARLNYLMGLADLTGYDFVKKAYENELDVRCSINRKGLRGRDDIVKVVSRSEEKKGALESFKEKITSFFRSGI